MMQKEKAVPEFDYTNPRDMLSPSIVRKLAGIHEYRGKQELYAQARPDVLKQLLASAKVESVGASNRIEGIATSQRRLSAIMDGSIQPHTRDEQDIAGYRDVLALIHESHEFMKVAPGVILQMHAMLYKHSGHGFAGKWKDTDNAIIERDADGFERVRFRPLPAVAVPAAMDELCAQYETALLNEALDPLLLIARFVFDFVSIHPFTDGNGRMSRLLTLLLLYQNGFFVGKYVSIEGEIDRTRQAYYDALEASSTGWNEGSNDYEPFVDYLLGVVTACYADLDEKMAALTSEAPMTKAQRVEAVLASTLGKVSKRDIAARCPDIASITIERTLKQLLDEGKIKKVGAGRATAYVWKGPV